jgi:hypothetical protein
MDIKENRKNVLTTKQKGDKTMKKAMLVYQAGIANVFQVDCFNLASFGREAKRLYQGDFRGAVNFARGLGAAGVTVMTAHCNMAGDIIDRKWSDNLDEAPFSDKFINVHLNTVSGFASL